MKFPRIKGVISLFRKQEVIEGESVSFTYGKRTHNISRRKDGGDYQFTIKAGDEEFLRGVLGQIGMQHLMSKENRVSSNNGYVVFRINERNYADLGLIDVLVPTGKRSKHDGLNEDNIWTKFERRNMPQVTIEEKYTMPEHLKVFRDLYPRKRKL